MAVNPFSLAMRRVIAEQYAKLPIPTTSLSSKTYIVTGSNNGLGLETARHLVRSSASRVILAVRNTTAGESAKVDIERSTGRKGVVEVWPLDLASFDSVKKFASRAERELERVDGLIENAGAYLDSWTLAEGMETSMTVNVVSTMFLGVLLMPKLADTARKFGTAPRVVFLVSGLGFTSEARGQLAKGGDADILQALNEPKKQNMDLRYVR
jgi:NAD(P)-dependent dehydrogenase (short-subunit alcohol dehydrogenase family)